MKDEQNETKSSRISSSIHLDHLDTIVTKNNSDYCSFSSKTTNKSSESNPVQQLLQQATSLTSDLDNDDDKDEEKTKLSAAKKLLFPNAVATSFSEVETTLRTERRQEFCPIYKDETPEEIALRQTKRKPIGSLLAKRIRWDDLKRKREEEEEARQQQQQQQQQRRQADMSARYGSYGPIYSNSNEQYHANNQQTFANPYEQYYTAVQNQYEQMSQMNQIQQEYNGFWPEYSQTQSQNQSYTYPYPSMYMNSNIPSSEYDSYLNRVMQPPPPPPNEPYPY